MQRNTTRLFRLLPALSAAAILVITGGTKVAFALAPAPAQSVLPTPLLVGVGSAEVILGLALVLTQRRTLLALVSATGVVMLSSTLVIMIRGNDVARCGCFGHLELDARTHALIALAIVALPWIADRQNTPQPIKPRTR